MNAARQAGLVLAAVLVAAAFACASPVTAGARRAPELQPVASLDPVATQRQWRRLVRVRRPFASPADCRSLRAVFYAATDWLRLATRLAANASSCADYYISIPPLASNKTQPRADQAWRTRALGPRFHALAEIHMAAWAGWVTQNGSSWYDAGVEARRRMAAAGYDAALGDAWVVNEFSSAVRRGDGTARAASREFVRGLFDGGPLPDVRGAVFITGMGQGTRDLSVYKANLQSWLEDAPFWQDMAAYVADFSQELYGDVRNYAVPGAALPDRRVALDDYLQHVAALARAGPETTAAARTFLESSYSPLANAAWQWESSFGWTLVDTAQMQHYVSAQTYALRHSGRDRFGFAWAPRNGTGLTSADFTAQTGAILDRLAAAIRDSGQPVDQADPGIEACGAAWCGGEVAGGWFNTSWSTFAVWTSQALVFTTPPQTLTAGIPSAPLSVQLQTEGAAQTAAAPLVVTLTSTSPSGAFALSPAGPWAASLAVTIPVGSSTSESFYYLDQAAGTATLIASAPDVLSATQTLVVAAPASPPSPTFTPPGAAPKIPVRVTRRGSAGPNVLVGGPLGDRLFGLAGNDLLRGRAGNDRLDGGRGRDRVFGDNGADLLIGGPGRDRLVGGRGGDRIRARDGERDVIDCGPGRDRVSADRVDRVGRSCESRSR